MELIADILLVAGAMGAGLYCFVLSRRLKRFADLEKGVGGAVAVLSTQAEELRRSLDDARNASDQSGDQLRALTARAETVAQRLELMMASMHDVVPEKDTDPQPEAEVSATNTTAEVPEDEKHEDKPKPQASEAAAPEEQTRVPEGLMFFRHDRKQGEAQA
ncbi:MULTISPECIES: DUF6468 domain-containing protein [unclassified Ruegeria]|uniref:DUF6468 domain-containing protein n=1 Tax=unclassified Ruegeria TaxID=2625375 RepID=UPI001AE168D4|nr:MULTISPECIES: DUF6468 domain-containing protein [unclassified Ruegeria]